MPRQGQERGGLGLFQPCFALNRRPLSCAFTKIRGILPHEGGGRWIAILIVPLPEIVPKKQKAA
ncbi:hypothetical protein AGMMS50256_33840 [Betaproteobacteria bacterium]|nr:hypothetical protein AGMMS50256_33840 [Betaproteobacteria bacterium]